MTSTFRDGTEPYVATAGQSGASRSLSKGSAAHRLMDSGMLPRTMWREGKGAYDKSDASDDDLITAAQLGDHGSFVELCRRHSAMAKRKIFTIVRNQEDAEDALQDTLLRAFTHLNSFRRSCRFSTWLTTIGVNSALMIMRKRRNRGEVHFMANGVEMGAGDMEPVDRSPGPENVLLKKQAILLVRREIERLKPNLRTIVEHYYESDCSLKESARAHDVTLAAVKSRLMRGRGRLRSSLAKYGAAKLRP